jgi:four helix bundle protein
MAESYKNLKIWSDAILLAEDIYKVTKKFPKDEMFGTVSQLRRAVVSVSSNIAEGSSRVSKKDFTRFIDISIGSLHEVESLLYLAYKLEYVSKNDYDKLVLEIQNLGLLLGGFRKYLSKV